MLIDGLSARQLQLLALTALVAAKTLAEDRVYLPRAWPTDPKLFPMMMVATPRETKKGDNPGQLMFTTTITLAVIARLNAPTVEEAHDSLNIFAAQIEDTLMFDADFAQGIQQLASIDTQRVVTSEGKTIIGEAAVVLDLVVYQAFWAGGPPLTEIAASVPVDTAANITVPDSVTPVPSIPPIQFRVKVGDASGGGDFTDFTDDFTAGDFT